MNENENDPTFNNNNDFFYALDVKADFYNSSPPESWIFNTATVKKVSDPSFSEFSPEKSSLSHFQRSREAPVAEILNMKYETT